MSPPPRAASPAVGGRQREGLRTGAGPLEPRAVARDGSRVMTEPGSLWGRWPGQGAPAEQYQEGVTAVEGTEGSSEGAWHLLGALQKDRAPPPRPSAGAAVSPAPPRSGRWMLEESRPPWSTCGLQGGGDDKGQVPAGNPPQWDKPARGPRLQGWAFAHSPAQSGHSRDRSLGRKRPNRWKREMTLVTQGPQIGAGAPRFGWG